MPSCSSNIKLSQDSLPCGEQVIALRHQLSVGLSQGLLDIHQTTAKMY